MIPETARPELIDAMSRFDRELRHDPEWSTWPDERGSHRWAISHEGQLYPVKQIISMATGQPASTFSGGDEANSYLTKYGFTIVPLPGAEPASEALARYSAKFADLRSQVGETWWPAATLNRAPHKPLLLLSVMDLIASGDIRSNEIALDGALRDRFRTYWSIVMPPETRPNPAVPFKHLSGDGFWHLDGTADVPEIVAPSQPGESITGESDAQKSSAHARFDSELFELLINERSRRALSDVLLESYFTQDARELMRSIAIAGPT